MAIHRCRVCGLIARGRVSWRDLKTGKSVDGWFCEKHFEEIRQRRSKAVEDFIARSKRGVS